MPTFRVVWLLRNLSLDGKLCLRDVKKILRLCKPGEYGKRHAVHAHRPKPQAVSDWLNPHSLGTMSAFGCIENLA